MGSCWANYWEIMGLKITGALGNTRKVYGGLTRQNIGPDKLPCLSRNRAPGVLHDFISYSWVLGI